MTFATTAQTSPGFDRQCTIPGALTSTGIPWLEMEAGAEEDGAASVREPER